MGLTDIITELFDKLYAWIKQLVLILPNLLVALTVLIVAYATSAYVRRIVRSSLARITRNEALDRFLARLSQLAVLVLGLLIAINILKLDKAVFSLLAGIGVLGIALAFAFQDIAANFVAGIALVFRRDQPFKVGDIVETNGKTGTVQEINIRDSMIRTFQGQEIFIPNKLIFENEVTNYSFLGKRRIDLEVGVSYGDDLAKVKQVTETVITGLPNRLRDSGVEVFFTEFGSSSINLVARFWIEFSRQAQFLQARSEAILRVKAAYDKHEITIPFPIRTLDFGIKGGAPLSSMTVQVQNRDTESQS